MATVVDYDDSVRYVVFPSTVRFIHPELFKNDTLLLSVEFNSNLSSIPDRSFYGCNHLNIVSIPNNISEIGESAFEGCSGVDSLYLGVGLSNVQNNAFSGCRNLRSIYCNARRCNYSSWMSSYPTKVIFGDSVKSIPSFICAYAYRLQTVRIPDGVESIGRYAFINCRNLTSITFPNSVKIIGEKAFQDCSNLPTVLIPDGVDTIGENAFYGCTSIDSIYIGVGVKMIGKDAFAGIDSTRYFHYNAKNCKLVHSLEGNYTSSFLRIITGCEHNNSPTYTSYYSGFEYQQEIKKLIIGDSVRRIPQFAFYKDIIDTLTLGANISNFGDWSFYDCAIHHLCYNTITLRQELRNPDQIVQYPCRYNFSTYTYNNAPFLNSTIGTLTIGKNVRYIPDGAFRNSSLHGNIVIPENVVYIGHAAFQGCSGVNGNIIIPNNVRTIGAKAFYGCRGIDSVYLGRLLDTIGDAAFQGCNRIRNVIIPNNVKIIGNNAFYGCSEIDSVYLGCSLDSIGCSAFQGLNHLKSIYYNCRSCKIGLFAGSPSEIIFDYDINRMVNVYLGDSILTIPAYCFQERLTLGSLNFNVKSIGAYAFANCDNILSLDISNAPVEIGAGAFAGCDRLVTVNLGDSAKSIGDYAFENCFRMNSFTMGNAVTRIGGSAFEGCVRLPMPKLSTSLTYIGESAFEGCSQIQGDILFPQQVDTIGDNAFAGCGNITSLKMKPIVPPTIFAHTFDTSIYAVPVYVPCNSYLQYYVTDYWENFPNLQGSQPFEVNLSSNNDIMGEAVMTTAPTCADHHTVIAANAYSGFHFVRWSDGSTSNPRHLLLAKDTTLEAIFAVNNAYITVHSSDSIKGIVSGSGMYVYNAPVVLRATPNNGYHFLHWSDGNTSNPRYLSAIQDSSFTAIFVSNISTVNVFNNNPEMGTVSGGGLYYYQNYATLTATPHYGYHFNGWNDGNIDNPRVFMVDRDVEYTASFAHNLYAVAVNSENSTMGYVEGGGNYVYNMLISIQATPNYGYHFAQWNDGNTQNPRTITVTADSSFTAQFSANTYQLFVSSDNPDMGSAYGAGSFTYNAQTTIAATPNYGYHFTQWSDGSTENPRIVTITRNTEYKAQFAINFYTITANSSNPAMGSTSGGGSYNYNSTINLSATPNYGYHFTQWSDGNTQNPRSVTVMQNAVYTAQFAINSYAIQVNTSNSMMGSVTGSGSYIYNTTADITATPNYGYHFVQWNDGSIGNPKTVIVTQDAVFTAQFDYNSYLLTAVSSDAAIGSVTGGGLYNYNSVVLVTATPNEHYHFVQWNDSITDNPRTIFVTNNLSLTAQFAIDQHILTVQSGQPAMGTTTGGGTYSYGEGVYIHAVPNYGYHFVQWSDGNMQNPRRVVVGQDTSFTALFDVNIYSATVRSNDSLLGTVCCSGNYPYRTQISLSATPAVGHHFVQWDDGNTENPRSVTLVQDTTLTGQFAVNVYTLSVGVNDTTMGYATGSGDYDYMSSVTISATARPHHHFLYWSDGSTSNPRQITITDNVSLYAQFEEDAKYTIHVLSMDTTMGCTSGSGLYYVGTQVDIAAEAKEHYRFTGWIDGVSDNPRRITVLENANFVALFEPLTYEIIALSTDNNMGTVIGGGMYSYGSYAQLQTQPNEGYHFVCWNDHDSSSTRFVLVEDDAVYVATFAAGVSVAGHTAKNVSLYPNPTTDMVYVASDAVSKLEVLDLTGRVLLSNEGQNSVSMRTLPSGVYLVRIHVADALVCRRVVKR